MLQSGELSASITWLHYRSRSAKLYNGDLPAPSLTFALQTTYSAPCSLARITAIEDATKACELTEWKDRYAISALAACYAEDGDFTKAVEWQTKAVELATGDWKSIYERNLTTFREGKTLRANFKETSSGKF